VTYCIVMMQPYVRTSLPSHAFDAQASCVCLRLFNKCTRLATTLGCCQHSSHKWPLCMAMTQCITTVHPTCIAAVQSQSPCQCLQVICCLNIKQHKLRDCFRH
jgi:hypothetical protein